MERPVGLGKSLACKIAVWATTSSVASGYGHAMAFPLELDLKSIGPVKCGIGKQYMQGAPVSSLRIESRKPFRCGTPIHCWDR